MNRGLGTRGAIRLVRLSVVQFVSDKETFARACLLWLTPRVVTLKLQRVCR